MTSRHLTHRQRVLARQALGLPNMQKRIITNAYTCPCAPGTYEQWSEMVDAGLADCGPIVKGERLFRLTREGAEQALELGETIYPEDFPK